LKLFRSFSFVLAGALFLSSVARSTSATAGSPQPCKKLALSVGGVVRSWTPPSRRLFSTAKVGPPLRLIGLNEGSSPIESVPRKILSPDKQLFVLSSGSLAGIVQIIDVVSRGERTIKVVESLEQTYEIFGWLDDNTVVVRVGTFSESVLKLVRVEPQGLRILWDSSSALPRENLLGTPVARYTIGLLILDNQGFGPRLWFSYRQGSNGANIFSVDGTGELHPDSIPGVLSADFFEVGFGDLDGRFLLTDTAGGGV
jgi:hypothetical protein